MEPQKVYRDRLKFVDNNKMTKYLEPYHSDERTPFLSSLSKSASIDQFKAIKPHTVHVLPHQLIHSFY